MSCTELGPTPCTRACDQVTAARRMEKSREHQEQNLQREYQGKNQELTQLLLACQMELAGKV